MEYSISVCQGAGYVRHNNRDIFAPNVDPSLTKDNVTYKRQTLEDAYEECFGDAIREYDANQKRKDRKIGSAINYIDKIKNSKNGEKPFYEIIVQIGNHHDIETGTLSREECKQILTEYMKTFEARNPNIHVFNAVLHMDEPAGTPHIHIDYIPVARQYQRGLQVRNSLDKALKQQGVTPMNNTRYSNATLAWEDSEKACIESVMRHHDMTRKPDTGLHRKHLSKEMYLAYLQDMDNRIQANVLEEESLPEIEVRPNRLNKEEVIVKRKDLDCYVHGYQDAIGRVSKRSTAAGQRTRAADAMMNSLKSDKQETVKLKKQLDNQKDFYEGHNQEFVDRGVEIVRLESTLEFERQRRKKAEVDRQKAEFDLQKAEGERDEALKLKERLASKLDKLTRAVTRTFTLLNNLHYPDSEFYLDDSIKKPIALLVESRNFMADTLKSMGYADSATNIRKYVVQDKEILNRVDKRLNPPPAKQEPREETPPPRNRNRGYGRGDR